MVEEHKNLMALNKSSSDDEDSAEDLDSDDLGDNLEDEHHYGVDDAFDN